MTLEAAVITALAVYRLSYLITLEEGPFSLAARFREWVESQGWPVWVHEGVNCPLCVSFWLGGLGAAYLMVDPALGFIPMRLWLLGLALSGVTVALNRMGR